MSAAADPLAPLVDALAERLVPKMLDLLKQTGAIKSNRLLTVREAAKQLGLSQPVVYQLVNSGALARVPDMKQVRISTAEIEAFGVRKEKK